MLLVATSHRLTSRVGTLASVGQALVVALALAGQVACDAGRVASPKGPHLFLTPPSASIAVGDSATFSASDDIPGSSGYTWTSSAPAVATVSATGVVRGLAPGRSSITVSSTGRTILKSVAVVDVRMPTS